MPSTRSASAVESLSTRQLNRATLARQLLLARERLPVVEAVERLAGLQAQIARPPFVGLWTRLESFRAEELLETLRRRDIVRVTAMRATLHFMSTRDYVTLRGSLQPLLTRGMQAVLRNRMKGIDAHALDLVAREFFGRAPATFDAFRAHLKKKYPKGDERAMAYMARTHVPLVQVPTDAEWGYPAAAQFTLADSWCGTPVSTTEAPAHALVKRYLAAFGPATAVDAQTWSGLAGLRAVFDELRPTLVTFRDERKRELFDLPEAPRPSADAPAPIRFLPEFDNLVLAHDDRSRIIATEHRPLVTLKNLQVRATFLVNGTVAGTWRVVRKRKAATLQLEPFIALTRKMIAGLEEEGEALVHFAESDATTRDVRVVAR